MELGLGLGSGLGLGLGLERGGPVEGREVPRAPDGGEGHLVRVWVELVG